MAITASDFQNIELAIAAYVDEAYTAEKRITTSDIVTEDPRIDANGESYIGQLRMYDPISANINTPSLTDSSDGSFSDISTHLATYIKGAGSFGVDQVNLQELVSQEDGFDKVSRDMAEIKAQHRQSAVMNVLRGVAAAEANTGSGGVVDFSGPDPASGFYVDVNADGEFGSASTGAADARKLIDASSAGAAAGERLFRAVGMAFMDYEDDFFYMIANPEMLADLRSANLVDETVIEDGNLQFQTIFGGKFRLLLSRTAQGNRGGDANVQAESTKTTFVVRPGAVKFRDIAVPNPVEIDRDASTYKGGGNTELWHRWSHIVHPQGYSWNGSTSAFASPADYNSASAWVRKSDPLNLSVLPIFHA
jgi:hypothetical protein